MQTGKLKDLITIQRPKKVNNAGAVSTAWEDVGDVWAFVKTQRGNEAFEAARTDANSVIRVLIRYPAELTETHRILWLGRAYDVRNVDPSNRRKGELWFTAEALTT